MTQGRIATVFGGTGFVGHAVVQALLAQGYIVRVPTRDAEKAKELLVMGPVGHVIPIEATVKSDAVLFELLQDTHVVINLIGELFERGKNGFQTAHVETAARLARMAKAAGVEHFVHVSALGADTRAKAKYARTKAIGEEAVRAFFPDAIVLRPSLIFGPRDKFFNRFALYARYLPFLPLIGGGHTKFQPIYVGDVAGAVVSCLVRTEAKGRIFALGGPRVYSYRELMQQILSTMGISRLLIDIPWGLAKIKARLFELLPNPPLTRDQIMLLETDNVVPAAKDMRAMGALPIGTIKDLGITPRRLEDILPSYLLYDGRPPETNIPY